MTLTAFERKKTQAIAGNLMGSNQDLAQHVLDHDADLAGCDLCTAWRCRPDMLKARALDEAARLEEVTKPRPPVQPPFRRRL